MQTKATQKKSTKKRKAPAAPDPKARFWRMGTVMAYTGRSRSTTLRDETFPKPITLGPNAVAWESAAVIRWADEKIAASRREDTARNALEIGKQSGCPWEGA